MRYLAVFVLLSGLVGSVASYAQTQPDSTQTVEETESTSSEWQQVSLSRHATHAPPAPTNVPNPTRPTPAPTTAVTTVTVPASAPTASTLPTRPAPAIGRVPARPQSYRPAFSGDFATNRSGWRGGRKGGYHYQIGFGKYNIRRLSPAPGEVAYSVVPLPTEMNLNLAPYFTIRIDVVADSGRVPSGGLLFGVRDSLNLCAFRLRSDGTMALTRLIDGQATDSVMTDDFFRPGVPVEPNRNQLVIRRVEKALHVYINQREVRGSPFVFEPLPGNRIGVTSSGDWTSFQKLLVTLGPDDWIDR
ncbi:hypothetical protein [uncultured Spirosoma sp.]|uniref:hypothetical protein n=1 Tax=uncultured Spirosoma sp. TaxID=278208 RepID=UPI002590910E|nr:hypothetical protein [uncultured Spirosoma sp.]